MQIRIANQLNTLYHAEMISEVTGFPVDHAPELPGVDWVIVLSGGWKLKNKIAYWRKQGIKVALYWLGSDVYNTCLDLSVRERIPEVDKHITVHERLVDELNSVSIEATSVGSFSNQVILETPELLKEKAVSVYLPNSNLPYLPSLVRDLSELFPDIKFLVYGNKDPMYFANPNVERLGYLDGEYKVLDVLRRSQVHLRWTTHDGFPRSVIESKVMGRHAITSYPYEGCLYAPQDEDIVDLLKDPKTFEGDQSNWTKWYREQCSKESFRTRIMEVLSER